MRRWFLYGLIFLLLFGAFAWAIHWFLFTAEGARRLLQTASRWSPLKVEARVVRGQIAGHLTLEDFHVRWPQGEIHGDSFELRWQPFYLLTGRLVANELILKRVQVRNNSPPTKAELDLSWPTVPAFLTWLVGEIQTLQIEDLVYLQSDGTPFSTNSPRVCSGSIAVWRLIPSP